MKKLFLLGFAVILFAACQNNQEQFTRTSPEIDVAKALLKDYHAGDWEAWATHYADTAKIFHNTWDESKGTTPEETANSLKAILNNMSSYHFEEEDDLPWYEMVTNYEKQLNDNLVWNVGADLRTYYGTHFRQVKDLHGLSSWTEDRRLKDATHNRVGDVVSVTATNAFSANPWATFFNSANENERIDYF